MDAVPFHIGIATDNLDASMAAITDALGLTWTPPSAGGEILLRTVDGDLQPRPRSCISRQGPVHVDLMQGRPGTIWATDGTRLHHFAYWTTDLAGDVAQLGEDGWELEMTGGEPGAAPSQFAYLRRADGMRVELIDEANRPDYESRLAD